MAHLIDKDALVAEIERRVTEGEKVLKKVPSSVIMGLIQAYKNTLSLIDTLEVKEVDLEKEKIKKASILHSFAIRNQEVEDEDFIEGAEWAIRQMRGESVSEDLKTELNKYIKGHFTIDTEQLDRFGIEEKDYMYSMDKSDMLALVEYFTNWQKEQFEKNHLAACDAQANEDAEIERDFVMSIIENEHRHPTFDDAIKYGMRLQRENMMKDATDVTVHVEACNYPYIPQLELYDYDKDIPLAKEGDKYKVVLIKEE